MWTCAGTLHDSFDGLPFTIPSSKHRTPTADESAEDDVKCGNAHQGVNTDLSEETVLRKPNAWWGTLTKNTQRQRLEALSDLRIYPNEIEFSSSDFNRSGGKADVAKATYRPEGRTEELVAVKKHRYFLKIGKKKFANIRVIFFDIDCAILIDSFKEFAHEVEVMAGLWHESIVELIGFIEDLENGIAWIVLSWLPNGNVREFLATQEWEIPERISLIQDTFMGIKHLHSQRPPICHGDLKSFNILISSSNRAVITDFGSARAINVPEDEVASDEDGQEVEGNPTTEQARPQIHVGAAGNQLTLTGPRWKLRWAAPELVSGRCPDLSSDIWAAGWICWEAMTNKVPFPELKSEGVITLTVIQGEVPSPREDAQLAQLVALCSLMTDCWAVDPKARPTIDRCWDELQWMPSTLPVCREHSSSRVPSVSLLIQMANTNQRQGNYEKAMSVFQEALAVARAADDGTGTATEEWLSQALEAYARLGNDRGRAITFHLLGKTYGCQCKYTQAEEFYTRAEEIFTHLGDDMGRAGTLEGLGSFYLFQSQYVQAEEVYTRAQEIYTRVGYDYGRALALSGLGNVYRYQSKYTQAHESPKSSHALMGLGDLYRLQSNYIQSEELYNRVQEIYVRLGNDHGRANTLLGLGDLYRLQSKYTQAEDSYTQAHDIYTRFGDDLGQANTLHGMGDTYGRQNQYIQAEEYFTRAHEIYTRLGHNPIQANTLDRLGHIYRFQSKYTQAEKSFVGVREIFARLGNDQGQATALQ
ncbi:hypothetical protein FRC00_008014 [Tulasnella sp. 408]|nr:hypothetical protein FRC00_008014 [Tulasnella sp. 408]